MGFHTYMKPTVNRDKQHYVYMRQKLTNHTHNKEDRVMPLAVNTYQQLPNIFTVLQYLISNFFTTLFLFNRH